MRYIFYRVDKGLLVLQVLKVLEVFLVHQVNLDATDMMDHLEKKDHQVQSVVLAHLVYLAQRVPQE